MGIGQIGARIARRHGDDPRVDGQGEPTLTRVDSAVGGHQLGVRSWTTGARRNPRERRPQPGPTPDRVRLGSQGVIHLGAELMADDEVGDAGHQHHGDCHRDLRCHAHSTSQRHAPSLTIPA